MVETKEEIKKIMKFARQKQVEINKKRPFNKYIYLHVTVGLESKEGFIMDINPWSFDLRSRDYSGRDLLDGEYKTGTYW